MKVDAERLHLFTIDFRRGHQRRVSARFQLQSNRDIGMNIAEGSEGREYDARHLALKGFTLHLRLDPTLSTATGHLSRPALPSARSDRFGAFADPVPVRGCLSGKLREKPG